MIQVRISTQSTRIETSSRRAELNMQSQSAQIGINTEAATVEIRQPEGTLTIDSYPCRAAIGIKNARDMNGEFAQMGKQAAQALTAQYVQDGNRLADITNGANTPARLAYEHTAPQSLSITWANVPLPDISYQRNLPQISWTPTSIDFQVKREQLQANYVAGTVDTSVAQYASIRIETAEAGNYIDLQS